MAGANILVIKLGALGDFIQALGPMAAIRRAHPQDTITLLTTAPYQMLGRECGYFDRVLIDKRPRWLDLSGWIHLRRLFNEDNFSRVYDLQNNDRTSFYYKLFKPKPEWAGIAPGASHRNTSPQRTAGKAFDGHAQTLSLAGIHDVSIDTLTWMKGRHDHEGIRTPYVLIIPGGSKAHPQKRWPAAQYTAFCKTLAAHKFQPVILGSEAEKDVTKTIADAVPEALDLTGQTSLFDLAAMGRQAFGAVGNDTGPMHLIAPTGCPSIVLFSAKTNPKRHAPLGHDVVTIQKDDLSDLRSDEVWRAFCAQHSLPS
jgi:ADP-heptose:LPS heptosyltransferase